MTTSNYIERRITRLQKTIVKFRSDKKLDKELRTHAIKKLQLVVRELKGVLKTIH